MNSPRPLNNEQIECLNGFLQGTGLYWREAILIQALNELCIEYGYGRVGQLAGALEEIWRNPEEGTKKWQEFRDERMQLLIEDKIKKINHE
jgi:hypothetical protein